MVRKLEVPPGWDTDKNKGVRLVALGSGRNCLQSINALPCNATQSAAGSLSFQGCLPASQPGSMGHSRARFLAALPAYVTDVLLAPPSPLCGRIMTTSPCWPGRRWTVGTAC